MVCDVPAELAKPMQLIARDRYGNDVDVLDIAGPDVAAQGVCLLEGYAGFYHAQRTQVDSDEGAYQEGAEPSPFPRVEKRALKFTLGTQADTPGGWEDVETRLWRFLTYHRDGVIRVYSVRSGWRELWRVRLTKVNDLLPRVPGATTTMAWEIEATAYDPWWHSPLISYSVRRGDSTLEVDPATGDPAPGSGVWECQVPMLNPADTRCFPEFASNEITAPTRVWLPDGLTDRMVLSPAADTWFNPGQEFLIQTDPLQPTVLARDDSLKWAEMASRGFASWIRPGKVTAAMQRIWIQGGTADTEITAYYPQQWDRMFGGETPPNLENVEWSGVPDM